MFYMWLISRAPSEEERQIIASIRDEEIGHIELFRQIYFDLTGTALPQIDEELFVEPDSYCDGLARALLSDQNAVQKHRKILYAMQSRIQVMEGFIIICIPKMDVKCHLDAIKACTYKGCFGTYFFC